MPQALPSRRSAPRSHAAPSRLPPICTTSPTPLPAIHVATLGNAAIDITIQSPRLPSCPGAHVGLPRNGVALSLGGAFNCLIAAAALGARVAPLALVPDPACDDLSAHLERAATRAGFATCDGLVCEEDAVVQACVVFVDPVKGHTFMATNEEPAQERNAAGGVKGLPATMSNILRRTSVLVIDGYAVAGEPDLVAAALPECGHQSPHIWLDPQAVGSSLIASGDDVFWRVVRAADGLVLTMDEACAMLGHPQYQDPEDVVHALARKNMLPNARTVLVKMGAGGCVVAVRNSFETPFTFDHVPGFLVEPVDTCGCGDSFLGSFLSATLVHGCSPVDAAVVGNAAGAATSLKIGAGERGIASRMDVEELLKQTKRSLEVISLLLPSQQVP
jgi:sugar/nucleoside kinase (ribokinase family)